MIFKPMLPHIKSAIKMVLLVIFKKIQKLLHINDDVFIENLGLSTLDGKQKRVLISYISAPFQNSAETLNRHTNAWDMLILVDFFLKNSFIIDIINHNSIWGSKLSDKYDIIFGFGSAFHHAKELNPQALKILYVTEAPPCFVEEEFKKRLEYFHRRHKRIPYTIERKGIYTMEDFVGNDIILKLGNNHNWRDIKIKNAKIFSIVPTSFYNETYTSNMTKKRTAKRSFIWFGSPGAIHKGLDILIDVFKILTDFDLFVCGANKQELKELYNGERQNIHLIDFVDIASIGFIELLMEVTWVISLDCTEAC